MTGDEQSGLAKFGIVRILAVVLLVVSPVIYLGVAYFLSQQPFNAEAGNELMLMILLVIAVVQPALYGFIQKSQIRQFERNKSEHASWAGLYFSLSIIKMSLVEAIFIYGLVMYFISRDFEWMLYFYPIGIIWSFIYWPRRSNYEEFVSRGTVGQ